MGYYSPSATIPTRYRDYRFPLWCGMMGIQHNYSDKVSEISDMVRDDWDTTSHRVTKSVFETKAGNLHILNKNFIGLHICKNLKKKSFFRKKNFAIGLVFERFLASRNRFFEKVNGLRVLGLPLKNEERLPGSSRFQEDHFYKIAQGLRNLYSKMMNYKKLKMLKCVEDLEYEQDLKNGTTRLSWVCEQLPVNQSSITRSKLIFPQRYFPDDFQIRPSKEITMTVAIFERLRRELRKGDYRLFWRPVKEAPL
ncbi:hypothetical protein LXL04_029677 [Taraxacum kok-saghyz]